jgi:hypothetical protein
VDHLTLILSKTCVTLQEVGPDLLRKVDGFIRAMRTLGTRYLSVSKCADEVATFMQFPREVTGHGFFRILLGGEEGFLDHELCLHIQVRLADLEDLQHDKPPGVSCYERFLRDSISCTLHPRACFEAAE